MSIEEILCSCTAGQRVLRLCHLCVRARGRKGPLMALCTTTFVAVVHHDEDGELWLSLLDPDGSEETDCGHLDWGPWHVEGAVEYDCEWCDYELLGLSVSVRIPGTEQELDKWAFPTYRVARQGAWRVKLEVSWETIELRTQFDSSVVGFGQCHFAARLVL